MAEVQARWFGEMADHLRGDRRATPRRSARRSRRARRRSQAATESFRVQTPFLARFAAVSRDLQPGAAQLPRTLPLVNDALQAGVPAFRADARAGRARSSSCSCALEDLGDNPNTLLALRDLRTAVAGHAARRSSSSRPTRRSATTSSTSSTRSARTSPRWCRAAPASASSPSSPAPTQENSLGSTESTHPVDVPTRPGPAGRARCSSRSTRSTAARRSTASGRADCQAGQTGYPDRLVTNPRYPPDSSARRLHRRRQPRGAWTANTPGLAGGTFKARELGIDHLEDVP